MRPRFCVHLESADTIICRHDSVEREVVGRLQGPGKDLSLPKPTEHRVLLKVLLKVILLPEWRGCFIDSQDSSHPSCAGTSLMQTLDRRTTLQLET